MNPERTPRLTALACGFAGEPTPIDCIDQACVNRAILPVFICRHDEPNIVPTGILGYVKM